MQPGIATIIKAMHLFVHANSAEDDVSGGLQDMIASELVAESSYDMASGIYQFVTPTVLETVLRGSENVEEVADAIRVEVIRGHDESFENMQTTLCDMASNIEMTDEGKDWIQQELARQTRRLADICWERGSSWGQVVEMNVRTMRKHLFVQSQWIGRNITQDTVVYRIKKDHCIHKNCAPMILLLRAKVMQKAGKVFAVISEVHEWESDEVENAKDVMLQLIEGNRWLDYVEFQIIGLPRLMRQRLLRLCLNGGLWTTTSDEHGEVCGVRCCLPEYQEPPTRPATPVRTPIKRLRFDD